MRRRGGFLVLCWGAGVAGESGCPRPGAGGGRTSGCVPPGAAGVKRSYVYLPGLEARFLRVEADEPLAGAALKVQSFEFSRSIHAFWNNVAGGEARGWHPRWLHNEQSVWTPFGTANGIHCGLMNEDGMVEVDQGSFSIEPMLWTQDRLYTWTDVRLRQELLDGWMPVPSVIWEAAEWRLLCQAEATARGGSRVS